MPAGPASPAASTMLLGEGPSPRAMAAAIGVTAPSTKPAMRAATAVWPMSVDTDERGLALRDAAADPGGSIAATPTPKLVKQRHEDASATCADRVADRDRTAIDVDAVGIHLEHPRARDSDRRKGFVDLDQVERPGVDVTVSLRERGFDGERGNGCPVGGLRGRFPVGQPGPERRQPFGARPFCAHEQDGAGTVVHPRRVARGDGRPVPERATECGELLDCGVRAGLLVASNRRTVDVDRDDLVGEPSGCERFLVAQLGAEWPGVLLLPGDPELRGA